MDPIFGKPLTFYLFTLPTWQLISGWLMVLAVIACSMAVFFILVSGGTRVLAGRRGSYAPPPWRGLAITFAFLLLILAMRVYIGRFERLFDDHTIFAGVTYTDAHVTLPGLLVVCVALVLGAVIAAANALSVARLRWLVAAIVPAAACYVVLQVAGWYISSFVVKPNELVRERPYIAHNIELTRQAYGLNLVSQREFPAETTAEAADPGNNQATLQNIRLWDWRALQDTLRQIQEIRTYYDFPDIDIDRYEINGTLRQVMLATRELNVDKLPESSRNWINEKLIYTHGYGITMNPVNGFTPEGLPTLLLSNMPVQSTVRGLSVTRPEVYFGELTNTDVYVKTRQKEFNYPQGQSNSLTSYEGNGGIVLGGFLRRVLIALERGDVAKLPFSDDVNRESRLLMRRNVRDRVSTLAPFLTYDPDPYIVVGDDGRLSWIMDGFTTSDSYPYSRHYHLDRPGESGVEFVEILPFTPSNRNNLIGWIGGRSDGTHYGTLVVYDFPKTKLVDGPLQVEARIDQNAQLSGQLTLWNQQGSHVRRGTLLVIPSGRALLYAEPIYLQAERSPMPELRLVVLALQDRLAYGPTFESAMAALFGEAASSMSAAAALEPARRTPASAAGSQPAVDLNGLIAEAAKDLSDYQRLTAEGKLGEAGQKLEQLKRTLDELSTRKR